MKFTNIFDETAALRPCHRRICRIYVFYFYFCVSSSFFVSSASSSLLTKSHHESSNILKTHRRTLQLQDQEMGAKIKIKKKGIPMVGNSPMPKTGKWQGKQQNEHKIIKKHPYSGYGGNYRLGALATLMAEPTAAQPPASSFTAWLCYIGKLLANLWPTPSLRSFW
jgi:hypothetical protein|mmetsp:Transcript_71473/g.119703  ORF Transcript_71473/g.119703 Transcript_71473/m.119703 type:complete len:166 (+) Transcript_71473:436-933(+)